MHRLVFKAVERIASDDDIQELVLKKVAYPESEIPETTQPQNAE